MDKTLNFNKYDIDLFPSLSQSNEVFFGIESNLSQILLKYSKELKDLIVPAKSYKDKVFLGNLNKIINSFNTEVAKEINAERVQLCIIPDESDNAGAYELFYRADMVITEFENGRETKYLDFDKVADLEDIVVVPNVGYRYRNPKGKIIIITCNTGTIKNLSIDEIAGTFCHEIGHCFQNGIFGVYKDVADSYVSNAINENMDRVRSLSSGSIGETFCNVLAYVLFPFKLVKAVFISISDAFARFEIKNAFKKQFNAKSYRMKDQLRRLDNGDSKELFNEYGNQIISDNLMKIGGKDNDRDEVADKIFDSSQQQLKEYSNKNRNTHLEKKTNAIIGLFRSINLQFNLTTNRLMQILSITSYNNKKLNEISFLKRYEFFADIFATSYGFGPDLYKNYKDNEKSIQDTMKSYDLVGINNISLFKAAVLKKRWKEIREIQIADIHGTANERGQAMYTMLVKELDTNKTLTTKQKNEIKEYIETIKRADEVYYNDRKEDGFWFKYYNKLIDDRIKGISNETEEEILKPIEEIVTECMKEKKK